MVKLLTTVPVDIVSIIAEEVANLSTAPAFVAGPKSYANLKSDQIDTDNGVAYLDEPITSKDKPEITGAYTENYPIKMFFGKKAESTQMFDFANHRSICKDMRAVRREFINRLKARPEINIITDVQSIDLINEFDKNMSGVAVYFTAICTSGDSACLDPIPDDTVKVSIQPLSQFFPDGFWEGSVEDYWNDPSEIDPFQEPQNTRIEEYYWQSVQFPGGSQSKYALIYGNDQEYKEPGKTHTGYASTLYKWDNPTCPFPFTYPDNSAIGHGVNCKQDWTYSFWPLCVELCRQKGFGLTIVCNVELQDMDDFIAGMTWAISKGVSIKKVILGHEGWNQGLYNNAANYPDLGVSYEAIASPKYDAIKTAFPSMPVGIDTAPIEFENPDAEEWNDGMIDMTADIVREYMRDVDFADADDNPLTGDYDTDLAIINDWAYTKAPAYIAAIMERTNKKIANTAWGIDHGSQKFIYGDTFLSLAFMAKYHRSIIQQNIAHDNIVISTTYYRIAILGLAKSNVRNDALILQELGKLYKYPNPKYNAVTLNNLPGIEILSSYSETANRLVVICINDTSVAQTLPIISFKDTDVFLSECVSTHAESGYSAIITKETLPTADLKKFSFTTFDIDVTGI